MGNCCSPGFAGGVYDGVFLCCPLFPLDVLDEIWDLIESVSEAFPTYSYFLFNFDNSDRNESNFMRSMKQLHAKK